MDKLLNISTSKSGFTLVELLLYIGLTAPLVLIVSLFLSLLLQIRVKTQTIAEVEQQGTQVMQLITQSLRNAESITSPAQGPSGTSLVLDIGGTATTFDLVGGIIRITEGAGSPVALTSSRVTASGLIVHNVSATDTPGSVHIEFTLTHINPGSRNEYDFNKIFYGAGSLR